MKTDKKYASVFELNGMPKFSQAFPLALQHVVAMIVGCVTPAIVIAGVAGLEGNDKVIFVQAALFIAAISTLIQLFPLGGKIGSGLPVIMGVSFAYLPSMQAIAGNFDIATILGAQLIGGIVAVFVGIFVKKLRVLFPPLITGTVVFTIGLSLYPTAVKYMAGGASSPNYGAWQNWLVGFITLAVVIALNHFAKGILKLASILIGMIVGYIVSGFFGMIDFSAVGSAGMFQIPQPMYFGMKFEVSAIVTMVLLFVINSVQAIGDFSATTGGGLDREPTDKELSGGIVAYGITNIFGSFFGGLPTATFSQNVGIVATTKVVNRMVLGLAAVIILLAGVRPEILSAVDNDSAVCTRRCNDFGIRIDCNDRYQACRTAATYIPQHFNHWSCSRTWNGDHTVFRCTCKFPGMGDNGIWKITGCCYNNRGNFAQFDSSKR